MMTRPIKEMFRDILEEWDDHWKDDIAFYDFLNEYVEIDDDLREYVVKRKKKRIEVEG